MREHYPGLSEGMVRFWVRVLLDPDTTCACCGLPNREITRMSKQGPWWFFLGKREGRGARKRLTMGHIVPGKDEYGFVPMCQPCQSALGSREFNAVNNVGVLRKVTRLWDRTLAPPHTRWWLHTEIDALGFGRGGRLNRSPATARRDAMFKVGAPASTPTQASDTA